MEAIYQRCSACYTTSRRSRLTAIIANLILVVLLAFPNQVRSQAPKIPVYLEVTMYKVTQGKTEAYLNLVRNYGLRIYEAMVRDNTIQGWYFYEVVMSPENKEPYDFIGVKVTTRFSDMIDNSNSLKEYYNKIKGPKEPAFEQIFGQLQEYRVPVRKEIFIHRAGLDPKTPVSKFVQIDLMKPMAGKREEYVRMESQVFYPIHQERIKIGALTDWALYEKFLPFTNNAEFDFVTANFFDNPAAILDPKYEEAFNNIPNNIDFIRLSGQIDQTRTLVRSDIWKLVMHTDQLSVRK